MAALMLPRAVLTHLKAGVFAAFGPEPVLRIAWLHTSCLALPIPDHAFFEQTIFQGHTKPREG
jgi:hypothetical protein